MEFINSLRVRSSFLLLGAAVLVVLGAVLSISFRSVNWLLLLVAIAAVAYVLRRFRNELLFQVTDTMFKNYYLAAFLLLSGAVVTAALLLIDDAFTCWLAVIGYFVVWLFLLPFAGRAQIGATFIKEPSAVICQRGGMFLRIGWVKKGHRMLTNQAAQRLNAIKFLFSPEIEEADWRLFVKWFLHQLRDALDENAHLVDDWEMVTEHGGSPFGSELDREQWTAKGALRLSTRDDVYNMIRRVPVELDPENPDRNSRERRIELSPPYSRSRFGRLKKRPDNEVETILRAISVISHGSHATFEVGDKLLTEKEKERGTPVPGEKHRFDIGFPVGYAEQFAQYDILTDTEIVAESGLTPGVINWCMMDVPEQQKPRKAVFGGLRVIGFPWDTIQTHNITVDTWSEVAGTETGSAYRVEKVKYEFQEIGLGRQQLKVHVKRAETADGYAVDYFVIIFLHVRNVYKAMIDIDDWHAWVANVVVTKIRELTRRLPIHAAIDAKEHISDCIKRGVHGEDFTIVPELLNPLTPGGASNEDAQKEGRPRYRIHVVSVRKLRELEQRLFEAPEDVDEDEVEEDDGSEKLLESILLRAGIVVENMGIKDVIPSDDDAKKFIEALPAAIQDAQVRIRQGIGESGRIEREIAALASQGADIAGIFQLIETTKSVPTGSTVVLGGGGESASHALLAQLLRDRQAETSGKPGGSEKSGASGESGAKQKKSGGSAGSNRESGKRPERSRSKR